MTATTKPALGAFLRDPFLQTRRAQARKAMLESLADHDGLWFTIGDHASRTARTQILRLLDRAWLGLLHGRRFDLVAQDLRTIADHLEQLGHRLATGDQEAAA